MLQIPSSDQQLTARSRRLNSPSSVPFRSNLTAALRASDNANSFPQQLSPVSQVSDLAGRGENEEQYLSAFHSSFPIVNLKPGKDLFEPVPSFDDTTYNNDPPVANAAIPWSHLRAFSAPDPRLSPFSNHPESKSQAAHPSSPGAVGSFEASWNSYHVQSLNMPHQSNSHDAANASFWAFDDNLPPPIEQEDLGLDYAQPLGIFDRSRASSVGKPTYARSPHQYPLSSNLSIEENAIQSPSLLPVGGFDKDEKDVAAPSDGFMITYQADSESILNGLKSPVDQQQGLHYSELLNDPQDFWTWSMNDAPLNESLEGITELFPELPEGNGLPFQSISRDTGPTNKFSIPPSSNNLNGGLTYSSPPSKCDSSLDQACDPFPIQSSSHAISRPRRITLPIASPLPGHSDQSVLPIRSSSTKAKVIGGVRRSRRNSFNENRKPSSPTQLASSAKRGGRVGTLDRIKAEQIKRKRQAKSTCIRCRIKRITCHIEPGESECQHCLKQGCGCIRADFAEMTSAQTCNFIFQSSLSHITRDGLRRISIAYPPVIDADWLLNQLAVQHKHFDIEIRSITGADWRINLGRCYELLSKLPWQQGARRLGLDDLVHNRRMPLGAWLDCMVPGKEDSEFGQLLKYTNMPNRNTYTLVPLSEHERLRSLDVERLGDRDLILMSAQLCRIILRALELKGFRTLQKELGDISRLQKLSDKESVVYRTGQLLGTLRWRLALWGLSGNDPVGMEFCDRVKKITWSLYFWFLFAKQQLPDDSQNAFPKGTSSFYAETERTWDDFPHVGSPEGFQTWLLGAHSLIKKSLASATTTFTGPEQLIQLPNIPADATFQHPHLNWQLPMEPRKSSYDDSETNMTWEF